MKTKILKIIISLCLVTILLMSGCISNEEDNDNNGSSGNNNKYLARDDPEELDIPLYSGLTDVTSMVEDTLWTEMDVPSTMDKKAYSSSDLVDTIYN